MENTIMVYADRQFLPEEIELIKWTNRNYKDLSRKEFIETVCEFLNWKTPSGKVRTEQCGKFLEELERQSIITLPPTKNKVVQNKVKKVQIEKKSYDNTNVIKTELVGSVKDFEPIYLEIVRAGTEGLKKWKYYVDEYHMLGDKTAFGDKLFYLIKSGEHDLGCMQFSASAWALEARDKWICWDLETRKKHLFLIVNNSRFLLLPWIKVKNLASKALSLVARQIQKDWLETYCYEPVILETFVDLEHFRGTCYKAANWVYLGKTKGRGRMDKYSQKSLSQKAIFMYPLEKNFRSYLKGEIQYKRASEDDMWW